MMPMPRLSGCSRPNVHPGDAVAQRPHERELARHSMVADGLLNGVRKRRQGGELLRSSPHERCLPRARRNDGSGALGDTACVPEQAPQNARDATAGRMAEVPFRA